jgi:hypothetical protein
VGWRLLADTLVLLHLLFVLFVIGGGLLVLWWPRVAWGHLPAAVWGALIEFAGWICPLTPLEIDFRIRAGQQGYRGDFVEQYVLPVLYPAGLTRPTQFAIGTLVVLVNIAIYTWAIRRHGVRLQR